jgi:MFS family permease
MTGHSRIFSVALLVATLGYFVDVYDLVLFIVLKNPSLEGLGVPREQWLEVGAALLDTQMIGMLVGGIVWGVLGDKIGRTKVLFGSILLYSVANILNAFVHSIPSYHMYLKYH